MFYKWLNVFAQVLQKGLTCKLFTYKLRVIVVDFSQDLHLLELLNINNMNQNIWLGS